MSEFAAAYTETRERVSELVRSLPEAELALEVPACPGWSVRDLVAHLVGVADDSLRGNVDGLGSKEWTSAQIQARADRTLEQLLEEWEATEAELRPALAELHPALAGGLVGDVVTHEHDLRGAVRRPGARDSNAARIVLDSYVRFFGRRLKQDERPALEVRAGGRSWTAGPGDPAGYVSAEPFELLRGLTGRRTRQQIIGFDWSVDPDPYLGLFPMYGVPERPLDE